MPVTFIPDAEPQAVQRPSSKVTFIPDQPGPQVDFQPDQPAPDNGTIGPASTWHKLELMLPKLFATAGTQLQPDKPTGAIPALVQAATSHGPALDKPIDPSQQTFVGNAGRALAKEATPMNAAMLGVGIPHMLEAAQGAYGPVAQGVAKIVGLLFAEQGAGGLYNAGQTAGFALRGGAPVGPTLGTALGQAVNPALQLVGGLEHPDTPRSGLKAEDVVANHNLQDAIESGGAATNKRQAQELPPTVQGYERQPVNVGAQPAQDVIEGLIARLAQQKGLEQPVVPSRAPVEPSGGEISFRGQGVPSAMQGREMVPPAKPQTELVLPFGMERQQGTGAEPPVAPTPAKTMAEQPGLSQTTSGDLDRFTDWVKETKDPHALTEALKQWEADTTPAPAGAGTTREQMISTIQGRLAELSKPTEKFGETQPEPQPRPETAPGPTGELPPQGAPASKWLEHIAGDKDSPHSELAAELLKVAAKDTKSLERPVSSAKLHKGRLGHYLPEDDVIEYQSYLKGRDMHRTVLHEIIHALTIRKIDRIFRNTYGKPSQQKAAMESYLKSGSDEGVKDLIKSYQEAKKALKGQHHYGTSDLLEYMTESWTKPDFQKALVAHKGGGGKSLWSSVVSAVRRLIGLEPKHESLLADAMATTKEIIQRERGEWPDKFAKGLYEENAEPIAAESPLQQMRPAVIGSDGKVIVGEQGEVHNNVIARQPIDWRMDNLGTEKRGFTVDGGKTFLSRSEAAKLLGEPGELVSEHLNELLGVPREGTPGGAKPPATSEQASPPSAGEATPSNSGLTEPASAAQPIYPTIEASAFFSPKVLDEFADKAKEAARKVLPTFAVGGHKAEIAASLDAVDTQSRVMAQQARKGLEGIAINKFGKALSTKALEAATLAREANGNKTMLNKFAGQVAKDPKALELVNFAKANWDKLAPLVKRIANDHDALWRELQKQGIPVDYREAYIKHAYDPEKLPTKLKEQFYSAAGGKSGVSSYASRTFPTLADAVEAGYGQAIQWDAAKLTENRLVNGYHDVYQHQMLENLHTIKDPVSNKPILQDLEKRWDKVAKKWSKEEKAPNGYVKWSPYPGKTVAVQAGYESYLKSLFAESQIRAFEPWGVPLGKWALEGTGEIKHTALAYDSYHLMNMAYKGLSLKGSAGYNKGLALLEYADRDLATAVQNKMITQDMADWATANRPKVEAAVKAGANIGRIAENMWQSQSGVMKTYRKYTGQEAFNKFVFEKVTRGIMTEAIVRETDRGLSPQEVASNINKYFGNLGRQGVLGGNKTMRDLSTLAFLAPQWFESMAQTEVGAAKQALQYGANKLSGGESKPLGTLAKGTGSLILTMLAAAQVVNLATKGQPTWDNEEGHKMDVWIPPFSKGGAGYWISPLSRPAELTHDMLKYHQADGGYGDAAMHIVANKLSAPARAGMDYFEGRDYKGQKLHGLDRAANSAKELLPTPLPLKSAFGSENDRVRQLGATAGLKVDNAQTPEQRVGQLARQYNQAQGQPDIQFPTSKYAELNKALSLNDAQKVRGIVRNLRDAAMKKDPDLTEDQFTKALVTEYNAHPNRPLTNGKQSYEERFVKSLSPADRALYEKVKEGRLVQRTNLWNILFNQDPPPLRARKRKSPIAPPEQESP